MKSIGKMWKISRLFKKKTESSIHIPETTKHESIYRLFWWTWKFGKRQYSQFFFFFFLMWFFQLFIKLVLNKLKKIIDSKSSTHHWWWPQAVMSPPKFQSLYRTLFLVLGHHYDNFDNWWLFHWYPILSLWYLPLLLVITQLLITA